MEYFWAFIVIGGPIILGLAMLYATLQYRKHGRHLDQAAQNGARRVREDIRRGEERASPTR